MKFRYLIGIAALACCSMLNVSLDNKSILESHSNKILTHAATESINDRCYALSFQNFFLNDKAIIKIKCFFSNNTNKLIETQTSNYRPQYIGPKQNDAPNYDYYKCRDIRTFKLPKDTTEFIVQRCNPIDGAVWNESTKQVVNDIPSGINYGELYSDGTNIGIYWGATFDGFNIDSYENRDNFYNLYMLRGLDAYGKPHYDAGGDKLSLAIWKDGITDSALNIMPHYVQAELSKNATYLARYRIPISYLENVSMQIRILNDSKNDVDRYSNVIKFDSKSEQNKDLLYLDFDDNKDAVIKQYGANNNDDPYYFKGKCLSEELYQDLLNSYNSCSNNPLNGHKYIDSLTKVYDMLSEANQTTLANINVKDINSLNNKPYTGLEKYEQLAKKVISVNNQQSSVVATLNNNKKAVVIGAASVSGIAILGCFGLFLKKRKFN